MYINVDYVYKQNKSKLNFLLKIIKKFNLITLFS